MSTRRHVIAFIAILAAALSTSPGRVNMEAFTAVDYWVDIQGPSDGWVQGSGGSSDPVYANAETPTYSTRITDFNGGDLEDGDIVAVCLFAAFIDHQCYSMSEGGVPLVQNAGEYPSSGENVEFEIVTLDCSDCVVDLENGAKVAFVSVLNGKVWSGANCGDGVVNVTSDSIGTCERFEIVER